MCTRRPRKTLELYSLPTLQNFKENIYQKYKDLINLTVGIRKVQSQTKPPITVPFVVNLADPEDGPDQVGGSEIDDGVDEVNTSVNVGGLDDVNTNGSPDLVNLVEDHGPMNNPVFVESEYWITSVRSTSGYKGVSKCTRREG